MSPCPAGHRSDEPDFCSVCGVRLAASLAPPPPAASAACPSCGEPREDVEARYCEVCRFDFVAQAPGPPPAGPRRWELVVSVDPALDTDPDPEHPCPRDAEVIVVPVIEPDLLVGRHDETRAIHPEIALRDPGASRRHARFVLERDGSVALQDLASTNGTRRNGEDLVPGTRIELHEGDVVSLGRWTRITLRARR